MFCEPKIPVSYHHTVISQLVKERDNALKDCKELTGDLKDVTDNLVSMTVTMKEQSDAIDDFLKTIQTQKGAIEDLEARIAALEKPDPDMSIYDEEAMSTCDLPQPEEDEKTAEEEHVEQFEMLNRLIVLLMLLAGILGLGAGLAHLPKEFSYDLLD